MVGAYTKKLRRAPSAQPGPKGIPPTEENETQAPAQTVSVSVETDRHGNDLFIVDNSDDEWKVARCLHDWSEIAHALDIATGYFEIGSPLALFVGGPVCLAAAGRDHLSKHHVRRDRVG